MKADLHNHTKYSDGVLSVKELTEYKKKEGYQLIAITDHDRVDALKDLTKDLAIPILIGVELSTYYNGENIHLLGYFKNNEVKEEVQAFLNHLTNSRKTRVKKMISLLKENGIDITYDKVLKYADGAIARPHVAKAIQEKYQLEWKDIFDKYIGDDAHCYVPTEYFDFKDAVDFLHRNNALAVLAHPHYIKKNEVADLLSLGVDGIEIFYPTMDDDYRKRFLNLAKENNLLVTGGSDFHEQRSEEDSYFDYGLEGTYLKQFLQELEVKLDDWQ